MNIKTKIEVYDSGACAVELTDSVNGTLLFKTSTMTEQEAYNYCLGVNEAETIDLSDAKKLEGFQKAIAILTNG